VRDTVIRSAVLAGGGLWMLLCLGALLTPVHGAYETGMPSVPAWQIERWIAATDGRFLTYRQSLAGGNLLVGYWLATLAFPCASVCVQLVWRKPWAHAVAGGAVTLASVGGLAWLGGYHLFALIAAIPWWGVLATAALLGAQLTAGVAWLVGPPWAARRRRRAQDASAPHPTRHYAAEPSPLVAWRAPAATPPRPEGAPCPPTPPPSSRRTQTRGSSTTTSGRPPPQNATGR